MRNPFLHQIVANPWEEAEADVPEINGKAFELCRRLVEQVRETGRSASLVLHGMPGSGKTHLMARLRSYLEHHHWEASEAGAGVFLVAVRLQTTPPRIWRHLRRSVATDLMRLRTDGKTRLELLLAERPPGREGWQLDYALRTVLDHYRQGRHWALCAAWLRGEALPETALARLQLAAAAPEEESMEAESHTVVVQLCRLAAPNPVVFCFDQAEALETYPGDQKGLAAYGQAAAALSDELPNALIISSIQTVFIEALQRAVHTSCWDRMAQHRADLQPLTWEQGKKLIGARLQAAFGPADATRESPLWPLPEERLRAEFQPFCVARRLIHRAGELFEDARGAPSPARSQEDDLERKFAERWESALFVNTPDRTDEILEHGLPFLFSVAGKRVVTRRKERLDPVDLMVETADGAISIAFCNEFHATALAIRLTRIIETLEPERLAGLALVRDARLPISVRARKTRNHLQFLVDQGARRVDVSADALAALDALRDLLSDAVSGNLAVRGETVAPASVREWLATHLPSPLRDLIDQLLTPGAAPDSTLRHLLELLHENPVTSLDEAAKMISASQEEIAACAHRHSDQIGFLAGPPAVVFQVVP